MESNNNWIVWHKNNYGAGFSECELAWCSIKQNIRYFYYRIVGNEIKWHACAKPIKLYKWLLTNYAKEGDSIFDSHVGSGSIRIACYELGFDFTGCELDKDYFDAQEKRFEIEKSKINKTYIPEKLKNGFFD